MKAAESNSARLSREVGALEGIEHLSFEDCAPSEVELVHLETFKHLRGKGHGSNAMNIIINAADKNKVNLMLIPAGKRSPAARLIDFYKRFGFEEDGDVMRRSYCLGVVFRIK